MNRQIEILKPILKHKTGEIITIETDKHGVAIDIFWQRRLKDAKRDNCCKMITKLKAKKPAKAKSDSEE